MCTHLRRALVRTPSDAFARLGDRVLVTKPRVPGTPGRSRARHLRTRREGVSAHTSLGEFEQLPEDALRKSGILGRQT